MNCTFKISLSIQVFSTRVLKCKFFFFLGHWMEYWLSYFRLSLFFGFFVFESSSCLFLFLFFVGSLFCFVFWGFLFCLVFLAFWVFAKFVLSLSVCAFGILFVHRCFPRFVFGMKGFLRFEEPVWKLDWGYDEKDLAYKREHYDLIHSSLRISFFVLEFGVLRVVFLWIDQLVARYSMMIWFLREWGIGSDRYTATLWFVTCVTWIPSITLQDELFIEVWYPVRFFVFFFVFLDILCPLSDAFERLIHQNMWDAAKLENLHKICSYHSGMQ